MKNIPFSPPDMTEAEAAMVAEVLRMDNNRSKNQRI